MRKVKAHLELMLRWKTASKTSTGVSAARKVMKNLGLLFSGTGDLMTKEIEKNKVSNVTLSSVFISMSGLEVPENGGEVYSKEDLPSVEELVDDTNWEKWLMHQMAAQRCVVSILEDMQKPSVHCPGQPAVGGSVEQGSWTRWSQEIPSNFHCSVSFSVKVFSYVDLLIRANVDPYRPGFPFKHLKFYFHTRLVI